MKTLKLILFTLPFLFISNTTQAQFWKKLEHKIEKKVEKEAENRLEKRVNKKIDKTFDNAENTLDGTNKKRKVKVGEEKTDLPDSYHFEWKYSLKMESKSGSINMHYMLKQNATYFGMILELDKKETANNTITIMDRDRNAFITLMDVQGQKRLRTMNMPLDTFENKDTKTENFNLTRTDTKVILGYKCQGFKTQMDDGIMYMYIAKNAPISFNRAFGNSKNIPKEFHQKLQKELENGIMLESEFISTKNKKHNFKTSCIALKKTEYTLDISQYKSLKINNHN